MVCSWAISVFFLRFWRKNNERLFGFFAAAFLLLGLERVAVLFLPQEAHTLAYAIRLLGFLLILFAIVDKNRRGV